jgi:serine/threonine protein kinase
MGVVLYILLSGKVPFPGRNELEIITNVVKGEFHFNHEAFKNVSDDCKDLICRLLVKDVNKRYSAEEACNHRWISKLSADEAEINQAYSSSALPESLFIEMQDTVAQMRLRKAALTELASRISEKNFADFKEALALHDRDKTGKINTD